MIVSQRVSKHLFQLMGEHVFISMDELVGLEFEHYANLNAVEGEIRFSYLKEKQEENKEKGYVYLWLEMNKKDDVFRVVYVGKAGRTMRERCSQHQSGFRGTSKSPAALKNAANIQAGVTCGATFHVYARKSGAMVLFGERVSMHSLEEEALIKKLSPAWNKI